MCIASALVILSLTLPPPTNYDQAFMKILYMNKRIDPVRAERIADYVARYSKKLKLDQNLILSLIYTESHYNEEAIGTSGEFGLMQVMPFWANKTLCKGLFLYRTKDNIECGTQVLRHYIDRFDGSVPLGLAAYNRGEYIVRKLLRRGKSPIHWYVKRILKHKTQLDYIDSIMEAIKSVQEKQEEEKEIEAISQEDAEGGGVRGLPPRL